ncbi:hypothetical protein [Enterococcus hirae]|nr:hypothetical protein [Enterococcus hirae]
MTEGENVLTKATEYGVNQKWLNPYSKNYLAKKLLLLMIRLLGMTINYL